MRFKIKVCQYKVVHFLLTLCVGVLRCVEASHSPLSPQGLQTSRLIESRWWSYWGHMSRRAGLRMGPLPGHRGESLQGLAAVRLLENRWLLLFSHSGSCRPPSTPADARGQTPGLAHYEGWGWEAALEGSPWYPDWDERWRSSDWTAGSCEELQEITSLVVGNQNKIRLVN